MFLDIHTANDLHFTLKDVGYIMGILISFGTAWFKLKIENAKQNEKISNLTEKANSYYKECKDEFINAKNGRIAIRRDFDANIISNNLAFTSRLDKIDKDVKHLNLTINKVNVNLTEVKAKLDIMINK